MPHQVDSVLQPELREQWDLGVATGDPLEGDPRWVHMSRQLPWARAVGVLVRRPLPCPSATLRQSSLPAQQTFLSQAKRSEGARLLLKDG